jgi:2-polyprenyl-3-methyl-5-hydroxy-6-metoxy-1,4-benzoquinol methylase
MIDPFRQFYESVGERYPENNIVYSTLSGILRKKWIFRKLRDMPAGNLLDCGCNIGTLSREWRSGQVFGVDISYAVLRKGKDHVPSTNFIQADIRDLGMIRQASIDNAIACEVVEHLDKPEAFLRHLYNIMKKGGHLLITSPNFTYSRPTLVPLGIMRSFGVSRGTKGEQYWHTAYKPGELAKIAGDAGFRVVEQGSFEFELRGWLKPLNLLENTFNAFGTKLFPVSKLNQLIERSMNRIELNAFLVLDTFIFSRMLRWIFKEGRRSFIVAKK